MTPRIHLGGFRITLVRDGTYWWDGGVMYGVVPKTLWSRKAAADESNRIPLGFNCYVVETGEHTVLIDTGGGDKQDPRARERMKLPPEPPPLAGTLAAHGFDPERIDVVINSHLHWDHCGGNTVRRGDSAVPAFPRATYYTRRGEWEHAHERHPRDSVSYIDLNYDPLVESGRMRLLDGDAEIVPGVWMRHAPGHNRDLTVITASSGGCTFCTFTDLVPTAGHLRPTWVAAFDLYPLESIASKSCWLAEAVRGEWVCGFGHDPDLAFTRIQKHNENFVTAGNAASLK